MWLGENTEPVRQSIMKELYGSRIIMLSAFFFLFYDKDTQKHSTNPVSSDKKPNVNVMNITDFK